MENDRSIIMRDNVDNENQIQKRPKPSITNWIAVVIAAASFFLSLFAIVRTVGKEDIEINPYDYVSLWLSDKKIVVSPEISFKNYGKSTGTISSLEVFIVSTSTESRIPKYMRFFSDVGSFDTNGKWIPFLGYFIYPNDVLQFEFGVYQESSAGYGSFESGVYEYLIILTNEKEKTKRNLCYEFHIDDSQVKSILGGNTEYVQLTSLQADREKNLLNTFESFKDTPKGSDINDLQSSINFTVTFDMNGGIGGNGCQLIPAGINEAQVNGGVPTREGYVFSHWLKLNYVKSMFYFSIPFKNVL